MPKKDNTEGFPELLKQLADGFSIHTQIAARYWLALALVSAFTIMPNPEKGDLMLPFLEVGAEQLDYYSFSFVVISLLIIGYGSAHCQAIRTRMLAQKYIDSSETTFLNSSGIHVQDVLDCIMSPSITRVAPLVQILQGRQQFFEKKACDRSRLRWLLAIYFLVLRLVGVLALYVFPGYALARTFILGGLFHSSIRTSGIPVYLLWPFGIVAMLVLVQLFMTDLYYFRRAAGRICNNQSKERS